VKLHHLVLPSLCLGGAALLLAPARPSIAFSKIGGNLGEAQRDVRVHDNFLDAAANANLTSATQFPGYLGAELAIWKGIVEWGSVLHGDGTGDPLSNPLGNGGANFDAFWAGNADGIGTSNGNIASAISSCGGGGTLAYCETPISDGWRIRFCDEWTWDDGPGLIGSRWDVQGIMVHEYGHALGLGHSGTGAATMAPSVSAGSTSIRSIHSDDIAGIQCIYGVASGIKPRIVATEASGGPGGALTIHGTNFSATGAEVWFTAGSVTATGSDPIVRVVGVSSTNGGTRIDVTIPASAGPGDVIVNNAGSGHSTVSNAFPTDLVGTFGDPPSMAPQISSVTPVVIEALMPGTGEEVVINGENLDFTTAVLIDGAPISPLRYTIVDASTITLDMPQLGSLGAHSIGVTDGGTPSEFPVSIVAPALPVLQLGSGDPLNVVDRDNGLPIVISGPVGSVQRLLASTSSLPSSNSYVSLGIGNGFSDLVNAGQFTVPASGWLQLNVPTSALPNPGGGGLTFYCQLMELAFPTPFDVSNVQSMVLVQ